MKRFDDSYWFGSIPVKTELTVLFSDNLKIPQSVGCAVNPTLKKKDPEKGPRK